jgi:hypothetical protein
MKLILKWSNNSVSVVHFAELIPDITDYIKERNKLSKLSGDNLKVVESKVLEDEDYVEMDREFRDAWELDDKKKLNINLEKAKSVKLKQFNSDKANKLKEVEEIIELAESQGDEKTSKEYKQYKLSLNNLQKDIVNINNLEDLKRVRPQVLDMKIKKEQVQAKIDENLAQKEDELNNKEQALSLKEKEFVGTINAINGFMMLLPEMNKTLLAIQKALEENKDNTK